MFAVFAEDLTTLRVTTFVGKKILTSQFLPHSSTIGPSRGIRRVHALYTSIFAAAALADAQAKDKRRLEWKEKIAAVKEEVNELVDEEQRILKALKSRGESKSSTGFSYTSQYSPFFRTSTEIFPRHLSRPPLRSYHSGATVEKTVTDASEYFGGDAGEESTTVQESLGDVVQESTSTPIQDNSRAPPTSSSDNSFQNIADGDSENWQDMKSISELVGESDDPFNLRDERGFSYEDNTVPEWLARDIVRMKAIRKIALKQLAIRLLLRPKIAHNYLGLRARYDSDSSQPRFRTSDLLAELGSLRRRMLRLKTRRDADIDDLTVDIRTRNMKDMQHENLKLDRQVRSDTENYLIGDMSLDELLIRLANNLMQTGDPDRTYTLRLMLLAFTKTRQNDLGDLVLKALLPNKFPLSSSLILAILNFYYKSKNLKGFDLFLEMLRGDSYPVDMRNLGYYKRKVINGVEISVPPVSSANAVVYSTLIMASLRFDQPDRADAYLQAARAAGYMDSFPVLNAYLKFYTIRGDWERGLQTIKRTLAFIASSTEHSVDQLERLIALMVHLCDSCKKYKVSEAIITAAVESGFDWRSAEKQEDIEFSSDPHFQRWKVVRDSSSHEMQEKPGWEKCYTFVNTISEQLNDLSLPETDSARRWQKLMGTYAQEVLSAVVSGAPAQYNESKMSAEQENQPKGGSQSNRDYETLYRAENMAQAHQQEISSLKDEVAQLKRMVFELSQTTSNKPAAVHGQQPPPNGLGQLKNQLTSAKPATLEGPRQVTVRYLGS
ncbi:hypothetical protein EYZ11_007685 [Aspergillus tanneri]|uniref:Uncharacterized protein n=1 Tax=Aspergillus tanneri TaxID=1220188 RepID=A0A4S3JCD9_9EURO|nr:hypothetical protein EYZ11_007685 [Aspergillus tanneri]